MSVASFSALAFVPIRDVKKRFSQVVKFTPPEWTPLAAYFERNYIGTSIPAIFPIKLWNVHKRVIQGIPRTSNFVECFHNKLNRSLGVKRPPMWRFIFLITKFQQMTEISLAKINAGGFPRLQRRKYRRLNHIIIEMCQKYSARYGSLKFRNLISKLTLHVVELR